MPLSGTAPFSPTLSRSRSSTRVASNSSTAYQPALSLLLNAAKSPQSQVRTTAQLLKNDGARQLLSASKSRARGVEHSSSGAGNAASPAHAGRRGTTGSRVVLSSSSSSSVLPPASPSVAVELQRTIQQQQQTIQQLEQKLKLQNQHQLQPAQHPLEKALNDVSPSAPANVSSNCVSSSSSSLVAALPNESIQARAFRSLPDGVNPYTHYYQPSTASPAALSSLDVPPSRSVDSSSSPPDVDLDSLVPARFKHLHRSASAGVLRGHHIKIPDTSRKHSLYQKSYVPLELKAFEKLGRDYFASNNKSYVRSCLCDPGYGFEAEQSGAPVNFAKQITMEFEQKRNKGITTPTTLYDQDFKPIPSEVIKSYKRVGKDYYQSMNKSYISENLVDPGMREAGSPVRFTHRSTVQNDFVDHSAQYAAIKQNRATRVFNGENPGVWAEWDYGME